MLFTQRIFFQIFFGLVASFSTAFPSNQGVSVTQDTLGKYSIDIKTIDSSRNEKSDLNGNVSGFYSYLDPQGITRTIQYTAGTNGYIAKGNSLPVAPGPVQETPEVAQARAAHLAALSRSIH